ncbi:MAG: trimethylamine methyltransferase family protein, partial [Cyanobacteria bacterium P01_A01_bin.17]
MTPKVAEAPRSRRGGRGSRREIRTAVSDAMLPALKRHLPLTEPMDPDQIGKIDAASMAILEDVGVIFRDPVAIDDWRRAGADIRDGDR